MVLNNFCKLLKTPPVSQVYVAPPASLLPKKVRLPPPFCQQSTPPASLMSCPPCSFVSLLYKRKMPKQLIRYHINAKCHNNHERIIINTKRPNAKFHKKIVFFCKISQLEIAGSREFERCNIQKSNYLALQWYIYYTFPRYPR